MSCQEPSGKEVCAHIGCEQPPEYGHITCEPHSPCCKPTPSAPTPGEVEMLVRGREWDEIKGVLGTFSLNQHRVREAYEEALRHIEIAVSSLLSSHASKAREEGRKEGYEQGKAEGLGALTATGDAKTAFAGLMGYEAWLEHGKTYGFDKHLPQINPKKE